MMRAVERELHGRMTWIDLGRGGFFLWAHLEGRDGQRHAARVRAGVRRDLS